MYKKKYNVDMRCPLDYGMKMISGKWKSRIICLLGNTGPMHFSEFKTSLVDISDGVLASTLNELIKSDLIKKNNSERNLTAEYSLTPKGTPLIPILQQMCRWSSPYYKNINGIISGHCEHCEFYKKWCEETHEEE